MSTTFKSTDAVVGVRLGIVDHHRVVRRDGAVIVGGQVNAVRHETARVEQPELLQPFDRPPAEGLLRAR